MITQEKISLLSQPAAQEFVKNNVHQDVQRIVLGKSPIHGLDSKDLAGQVAARKKALSKLPCWTSIEGIVFPETQAMEQCSSEETAAYKKQFFSEEDTIADLTGGYGIDSFYISEKLKQLTYVERQTYLCDLAAHNFSVANRSNVQIVNEELENYLKEWGKNPTDWIYCDPARRNEHQRKVFLLEDCSPDLQVLAPIVLGKGSSLLAKLSPMLDIHKIVEVFGKSLSEIHVVSVNNECKELLLLLKPGIHELKLVCVNLDSDQMNFETGFTDARNASVNYAEPGKYLFEANASLMKAQVSDKLALELKLSKLEQHSYLYTSDSLPAKFPGRIFQVQQVLSLDKKALTALIPSKKANISVRNFPMKPEEIHKKVGFATGGNEYVFATTLANGKKVLIWCRKVTSSEGSL